MRDDASGAERHRASDLPGEAAGADHRRPVSQGGAAGTNGGGRTMGLGTIGGTGEAGEEINSSISLSSDEGSARIIETTVSPFHCLYQDALAFHTQSRLARSEAEASRLARASLLLYVSSAEALVHQAAEELGRRELRGLLADPSRPLPLAEAWRLLPAIMAEPEGTPPPRPFDPETPPWPQFTELLMLRTLWSYPGGSANRKAYYRAEGPDGEFEPLQVHQVPPRLRSTITADRLRFPRTGFPRDPYSFRPRHLDTARGILDAAIEALDRRMGGALCRGQRHRREPIQMLTPVSK